MQKWTDKRLYFGPELFQLLVNEDEKQCSKWGVQSWHPFKWLAIFVEEVGELSKAILEAEHQGLDNTEIIKEAIQVATLAVKILEMCKFEKQIVEITT